MICKTVKAENVFSSGNKLKLFYFTRNRSGILQSRTGFSVRAAQSSVCTANGAVISVGVGLRFHEAADPARGRHQLGHRRPSLAWHSPWPPPGATQASGVCTTHRPALLAWLSDLKSLLWLALDR